MNEQERQDAARWRWCAEHPYEAMLLLMEATNRDSYPFWKERAQTIDEVRNYFVGGVDEELNGPSRFQK